MFDCSSICIHLLSGRCPLKCTSVLRPALSSLYIWGIVDFRSVLVVVLSSARAFYALPCLHHVSGESSTPASFWLLSSQVRERFTPCLAFIICLHFIYLGIVDPHRVLRHILGIHRLPFCCLCPLKCTKVLRCAFCPIDSPAIVDSHCFTPLPFNVSWSVE